MAPDLPKRLFRHGHEPEIKQINNRCCITLLDKLEAAFPSDYDTVRKDPVFAQIMAIHKNCLNFSGRLVHRFMCNQLATSRRYEHWFTFAKRPLRFSLQEFHAITGLKYQYDADDDRNYDDWHDDGRYWSKLLKRRGKINLQTLKKDIESGDVNKWHQDDRVRLVYLCVIAGVIMARDDKRHISHTYIKLVMNLDKLRKYPWGLHSYDLLVECITKARVKLNRKISYTLGCLSQDLVVDGFDPSQQSQARETKEWLTPNTSFKSKASDVPEPFSPPVLYSVPPPNLFRPRPEDAVTLVTEEEFGQLSKWQTSPTILRIGPSVFDIEAANRIIGFNRWLNTQDIDAVMYLFQENTSLGRWRADRAAFMTCLFSNTIKGEYTNSKKKKKNSKLSETLLDYGKGVLPSHGRTNKMWGVDVDCIYVPIFVNGNHWISLCISFVDRRIEVFDCSGKKNCKEVEAFAVMVPRIVKEVQPKNLKKHLKDNQYSVFYVPMQRRLNGSCCDCGVYALKFIECHVRGIDISLLDDENIKGARHKIAFDLFQAALDPVLMERMSAYRPPVPKVCDEVTLID